MKGFGRQPSKRATGGTKNKFDYAFGKTRLKIRTANDLSNLIPRRLTFNSHATKCFLNKLVNPEEIKKILSDSMPYRRSVLAHLKKARKKNKTEDIKSFEKELSSVTQAISVLKKRLMLAQSK
ncbi:MAG: hypothetical protein COT90_04875 [Candidatus Diapherotrites archaeon CG10_big_fil_rev_8_21_14_0_10_31_34]|nr:MAG: hypothetical protein COT90_04875 [Candidatus Diapherotrites archaeon CG10_big_fil_rev_8_21_14_0_10_31_34]PJA17622.1 MAG: hypothetical protein COX63_02690 [Candidatus Diapherotrites archaeon CG_4_10_14_0_2_um_filter_31_5]